MALYRRLQAISALSRTLETRDSLYLLGSLRSYSSHFSNGCELNSWRISFCPHWGHNSLPWTHGRTTLHSSMAMELSIFLSNKRLATTQARAPAQARQMGALKVSISSPGFIYEPYAPREPIPFWRRWFTKSGWRRTKEDIILEKFEAYDSKGITVAGDKTKELARQSLLNPKTNALPFLRKQHPISPNRQSIPSLTTRFFASQSLSLNSFPDKPSAAYYDDLVNGWPGARLQYASLPPQQAYRIEESLHIVDIMAHRQYGLSACSFHPILSSLTRKKKMEVAWKVMEMMRAVGVLPDLTAFNYLLTAYCYNGNLMAATKVMKRIEEERLGADARTYDALVLGACRVGKVEGALVAIKFVMIYAGRDTILDTETFGILASKLIKLERLEQAKLVLEEMEERGLVMGDKLSDYYNLKVKMSNHLVVVHRRSAFSGVA
ncbi:hypothetical protein GH714_025207 [Hevea brasiliensis]|uniref:Pentacotripeptide-repeat region of PRORP domain-containing protein n=1 Tax=Hevea brasiliensis TaxID=3981 RepID=A0A6A6M0E3_HEVBR|nr:hypothetical protein GH714_025207 [Hevea brasiliensis]